MTAKLTGAGMVVGGISREDFAMSRPVADVHGYRGIEFGVDEDGSGEWQWAYYPKVGTGLAE